MGLYTILHSIIAVVPEREGDLRNSLQNLLLNFGAIGDEVHEDYLEEIFAVLCFYIRTPKKNWQHKVFAILLDDKQCLHYYKKSLN